MGPHSRAIISIEGLDNFQDATINTKPLQHLPQQIMIYDSECLLEVNEAAVQLATPSVLPCLALLVYQCPEDKGVMLIAIAQPVDKILDLALLALTHLPEAGL